MLTLRLPEAVLLFALPSCAGPSPTLALERRLYAWQVGRSVRDAAVRAA